MQKTISSYLERLQGRFAELVKGQSAEFAHAGRSVLDLAAQEFTTTTLANAYRELQQTQLELEDVSDQLLRAREQARLQQLEIERLQKVVGSTQDRAKTLKKLQVEWANKLRIIMVSLSVGKKRVGMPEQTERERIQLALQLLGRWLRRLPAAELTPEELQIAESYAQLPVAATYSKKPVPEKAPVIQLRMEKPATASHLRELIKLQEIMVRRSAYERREDRFLQQLHMLLLLPDAAVEAATAGNPVLLSLLKQWRKVRGNAEWLLENVPTPPPLASDTADCPTDPVD